MPLTDWRGTQLHRVMKDAMEIDVNDDLRKGATEANSGMSQQDFPTQSRPPVS